MWLLSLVWQGSSLFVFYFLLFAIFLFVTFCQILFLIFYPPSSILQYQHHHHNPNLLLLQYSQLLQHLLRLVREHVWYLKPSAAEEQEEEEEEVHVYIWTT